MLCAGLTLCAHCAGPAWGQPQSEGSTSSRADSLPPYTAENIPVLPGTSGPKLQLHTGFWHDIQLYVWQSQLRLQQALAEHWQLQAWGILNSTLRPLASGDLWKDDHQAGLQLTRPLPSGGRLELLAETRIFRDALTGDASSDFGNTDFNSSRVWATSEWKLASRLRFAPALGYRWEDILNRREHGPAAGLQLTLAPTPWAEGYWHQLDAAAQLENFPERRNQDLSVVYGVSRQFENYASDSLFASFNHLRRENYFTTEYVDLLLRNRRALENHLHYRLAGAWNLSLYSELGEADVEIARRLFDAPDPGDAEISRFSHHDLETSHLAMLFLAQSRLVNELSLSYRSRRRTYEIPDSLRDSPLIRRYASEGYDSDWWDFALAHRLQWRIGAKDSLRWYGRLARYALTTANLKDPNDHDRIQIQANVLYAHRFNSYFTLGGEARTYLEHQVYLKGNLSGDNRWMRIWHLLPFVVWEPFAGVRLKQIVGVRATYIDYDFPETLSRRRSIVFRDFSFADSLSFPLSARTTAILQYRLVLEERGLLDWERWLQSPQTDLRRQWAELSFWHRWSLNWQVSPGVSWYRESNWRYQQQPRTGLQRTFDGSYTIIRPMLQLSYVRPPAVLLLLHWRRQMSFRKSADNRLRRDRNIDTFNLTLQWRL